MEGRRDDAAPDGRLAPSAPPDPVGGADGEGAAPPPVAGVAPSRSRSVWLVVGLVLAAAGTAAVLTTDNPDFLRMALLAVCWAFVITAFLASGRRADQLAAAGREAELRHAYELEIEREVAARHEYQLQLESRLRRNTEDAVCEELGRLRTELGGLAALQADLAGLGELRTELTALTALRGELAGLGELEAQLAGLGELRNDLGRIRRELTEHLSGELLVERLVMRGQSFRWPAQPNAESGAQTVGGSSAWDRPSPVLEDVDGREETRVVPAEPRVEPWPGSALESLGDQPVRPADGQPSGEITRPSPAGPAPRRHRRAAEPDDEVQVTTAPRRSAGPSSTPHDGSGQDEMSFGVRPRHAAGGHGPAAGPPAGAISETGIRAGSVASAEPACEAPAADELPGTADGSWPGSRSAGSSQYGTSGRTPPPAPQAAPPEPQGHARLAQILDRSGVEPPSGGRSRRRRYRDEDGGPADDDVLARVLGQK